jgi:hypothetical protein
MCSETTYDPALLGGGKPLPGQNLVIVVARPEFGYYVNIHVSNTNNFADDFARVAVVPAGATLGPEHWISFDTRVPSRQLYILPNVGLGGQDQVIASSQNGYLSFNVTGSKFFNF